MPTKNRSEAQNTDLRPEYDLSSLGDGIRGRYFERATEGSNLVLLEPEIASAFPTAEAVNEALRMLLKVAKSSTATAKDT
jgi:hypothetical protein